MRYELNFLNIIEVFLRLRRSAVDLSPQRPGFDSRSIHVRLVVDKVALKQAFLPVLRFFPCLYHSNNAPYSSSSTRCSYQNEKRAKPGTFQKAMLFQKSGSIGQKKLTIFLSLCKVLTIVHIFSVAYQTEQTASK